MDAPYDTLFRTIPLTGSVTSAIYIEVLFSAPSHLN